MSFSYECPVDFSNIVQMTVYRSEGVQVAMQAMADRLGCTTVKADDGVILSLDSERELTADELDEMTRALKDGWRRYLAEK